MSKYWSVNILSYVCSCYAYYVICCIVYQIIRFVKSCLQTCRRLDYLIITHYANQFKTVFVI